MVKAANRLKSKGDGMQIPEGSFQRIALYKRGARASGVQAADRVAPDFCRVEAGGIELRPELLRHFFPGTC